MPSSILFRHSLKTRVTLFTLIIFVVSIWALAFYAGRILRENMARLLSDQQLSTVSFVASQINQEMAYRIRALELTASAIDAPLLANPAELQKFVESRLAIKILFNAGMFVTRADGTAVAEFPRIGRIGVNYIDRAHVAATLKDGKTRVGTPVMGKRLAEPTFAMTAAIRDGRGAVIGALVGATDLARPSFLDTIKESRYGQSGGYFIIDPRGRVFVTATDRNRVMQPLPAPGTNSVLERRIEGYDKPLINVNSLGVEVLSSAGRLPVAGWIVVATLPTAEAYAPIGEMQRHLLLATLIVTVIAGALTWWMLWRELIPIYATAKKLADLTLADQPPLALPVTRRDEIGAFIGAFNRLLGVLRQREAALIDSEARYHSVLDNAADAIFITDAQGRYQYANQQAYRLLGYDDGELLALSIPDITPCENAENSRSAIAQLFGAGRYAGELLLKRRDGSRVPVEINAILLPDGSAYGACRDITERKAAERQILDLNAQLEQRVRDRTANLEAANMELESFSYSIAHDLRTPLRGIAGFVRVIEEDYAAAFDATGRDLLQRVQRAAKNMGELIDGLLKLSRLTLAELHFETVDLSALARTTCEELGADESGRGVIFEVAPELAVRGDKRLLAALLDNLLGNAWKFTARQPDARIEFGMTQQDGTHTYYVRDNGAGFDMAHADNLFRPFFRLHGAGEFAGTGIGLATVQRIVQSHGGHVWAEGAVGHGATFYFTLST